MCKRLASIGDPRCSALGNPLVNLAFEVANGAALAARIQREPLREKALRL